MFFRLRVLFTAVIVAFWLLPSLTQAAEYDLSITASDVSFFPQRAIVNQSMRVTISVTNKGTQDAEGVVQLFDGDTIISSKAVSVKTGGRPDDVWVIWRPTTIGLHTLRLQLIGDVNGRDEDLSNNNISLSVVVDGDQDGDGVGDAVDPDIDGDGVKNEDDAYPFDPARSQKEVAMPIVAPAPAPATSPAPAPAPTAKPKPVVAPTPSPTVKESTTSTPSTEEPKPSPQKEGDRRPEIVPVATTTFTDMVAATATAVMTPPVQPPSEPEPAVKVSPPVKSATPTSTYVLGAAAALSTAAGLFFLLRGRSL